MCTSCTRMWIIFEKNKLLINYLKPYLNKEFNDMLKIEFRLSTKLNLLYSLLIFHIQYRFLNLLLCRELNLMRYFVRYLGIACACFVFFKILHLKK